MGIREMNLLETLKQYAAKWNVSASRNFTAEEIASVDEAVVVASEYGNSVCFHMKSGGMTFIPLSTNSTKGVGETIDLNSAKILTLSRPGDADINRVEA